MNKKNRVTLVFILVVHTCSSAASFHLSPITCGLSSWIQFPKNRDAFTAYTKLSLDAYLSYGLFKGFLGIPILYTLDKKDSISILGKKVYADTSFGRIAAGDFSSYIGIRIGCIEPRIGIILPLGYSTNSGVWLGSKNIILKTGAGFSGNISKRHTVKYGGEFYFNYYLAGFPEIKGSQGKAGSWSIEPDIKISIVPVKKWVIGIETLCGFRQLYPIWLKNGSIQGYELSASAVPHITASYDLSSKIYLGGKIGAGLSFKKKVDYRGKETLWSRSGSIVNTGISAGFYLR